MKKLFSIFIVVFLITACNKEKTLKQDLTGTWKVYKYLYHGIDKTADFATQYGDYSITFTSAGKFTRLATLPDSTFQTGSYYFANNDQQLVLVDSVVKQVDTVMVTTVNQETYTIFNLTSASVQLRTDTSELYMNKQK